MTQEVVGETQVSQLWHLEQTTGYIAELVVRAIKIHEPVGGERERERERERDRERERGREREREREERGMILTYGE